MSRPIVATITYCLSEAGRNASAKAGGSGSYHQNVSGVIDFSDLPLFDCADNGVISIVFNQVEFNGPQDFASLLGHLRKRRERFSAIRTLIEAEVIAEGAFGTG
jgi:hypothetical protein